jgi:hypothetical protein
MRWCSSSQELFGALHDPQGAVRHIKIRTRKLLVCRAFERGSYILWACIPRNKKLVFFVFANAKMAQLPDRRRFGRVIRDIDPGAAVLLGLWRDCSLKSLNPQPNRAVIVAAGEG